MNEMKQTRAETCGKQGPIIAVRVLHVLIPSFLQPNPLNDVRRVLTHRHYGARTMARVYRLKNITCCLLFAFFNVLLISQRLYSDFLMQLQSA
jgi:hypothetical protein